MTNADYNALINYRAPIGAEDYVLRGSNSIRIENNEGYLDRRREKFKPVSSANKLTYNIIVKKNNSDLELPVVPYSHTKVTINGTNVRFKISKEKGILLNRLKKGNKKIEITYQPSIMFYILFCTALVTFIVLFGRFIKNKYL